MYLATAFVYAIILVLVSPLVWVAWWVVAGLGPRANGSYSTVHRLTSAESRRRAA
jgi:hypothetical protein